MIRPAAAVQMHADQQAERLRADGITAMVALRSGTAEYAPLRNSLSDRNYRQGNEHENVQGNTEGDVVQGITKEDDAQDIDDKNNSPTALNAILPRMTRSTTRAAAAASGLGIVHHVFAAKEAKPNDAMDLEMRVNSINKEVRGLLNRGAFSLVHVDAVPSHANVIGTRIITRLKHFGTIDGVKSSLENLGMPRRREEPHCLQCSDCIFASLSASLQSKTILYATQEFLQTKDTFSRNLYARLPLELCYVFKRHVLTMLKPLCGIKEAGTYWNAAYSGDWKQKVGVTSSTLDPCFMTATWNQAKDAPHVIAAILENGTLMTGNKHFAKAEKLMHNNYDMGQK
jgi:hypothetical protein